MTIFGYNTDVKQADVVYHVQSEARPRDLLLQTLIFVQGKCVGKHAFSYAERTLHPEFSEEAMHELLKMQHKRLVEAVQKGNMEMVLASGEIQDVEGSGLSLIWTNASVPEENNGSQIMRLLVLDSSRPAGGATVTADRCPPGQAQPVVRSLTDASGNAVLNIPPATAAQTEAAVIVRAVFHGKSATRKFRLKK